MKLNKTGSSLTTETAQLVMSCLFLALCVMFVIHQQRGPDAVPADAPQTDFSSGRAMQHLKVIAAKPHPSGSMAQAELRDYLLSTLSNLGLQPEIQASVAVRKTADGELAGSVKNIVAYLKGTEAGGKAILLVAHYDSVANSYGASDDGSGVAAILETMRALKAGPALKNDVVALLTDGEESGMMGARAFVAEHPLVKKIGLVLNFEARGSRGPVLMFETSARNGLLITELNRSAPYPFANSFMYDIYKRLPNDTDLSIFKNAGLPGLNFANIEGAAHYHTLNDSLQAVDERSIQHHGSYALNLTRHFGNLNLSNLKTNESVYFDILGSFLIVYSVAWAIPLGICVLALFVGLNIFGWRKGQLTVRGIGLGLIAFLLTVVAAAGAVTISWRGIRALHTDYTALSNPLVYAIGFVALALATACAMYFWLSRYTSGKNLLAGALSWWVIFMVLASVFLPGASYLFTWPLLFGVLALAFNMATASRAKPHPAASLLVFWLCALPGIVLLTSITYALFQGLALAQPAVLIVPVILLCSPLLSLIRVDVGRIRWVLPLVLLVTGLGCVVVGNFMSPYDSDHAKPSYVAYSLNADSGEAQWVTDRKLDEWTAQFFPSNGDKTVAKAAAADLSADKLEVVSDRITNGARLLDLRITSPRDARIMNVAVERGTEVLAAEVNSKRLEFNDPARKGIGNGWELSYVAVPKDGIKLGLVLVPTEQVKIKVASYTDGLPSVPGVSIKPRPNYLIPSVGSDVTRVAKTFVLGAANQQAALR